MDANKIVNEFLELHRSEMMKQNFSIGLDVELENIQPNIPPYWKYTRSAFLYTWCVKKNAFPSIYYNENNREATQSVEKSIVPTEIISQNTFEFTSLSLINPFKEFSYYYVWKTREFYIDFDNLFIASDDFPDKLIEPSWSNYLKFEKILNNKFSNWSANISKNK